MRELTVQSSASANSRPSQQRWILAALVAGGALLASAALLSFEYWMRGSPMTPKISVLLGLRIVADALGLAVGAWWWWRAPANPTGRLLYLATLGECLWLIGANWPGAPWVRLLMFAWSLVPACLALIVLGWPTGRPRGRLRRAVILLVTAAAVTSAASTVLHKSAVPSARFPDLIYALVSAPVASAVLDAIQALAFSAVPAAVLIVALVRRRRALPPAIRPAVTPITVAGVVVGVSYLMVHVGYQLFGALLPADEFDVSIIRFMLLVGVYTQVGIVAVGVLIGATRRRRAVHVGTAFPDGLTRQLRVDLSTAAPVISPSAAAAALVGDPTATVRYRRPDGEWIDASGGILTPAATGRQQLPLRDGAGNVIAALELSDATSVPPLLADLALTTIAARLANERAAAMAEARRREVLARSQDLVAAADAGRLNLERNLHDGAQQLLVGLALSAGLAARHGKAATQADSRAEVTSALIRQISNVRMEILELIDSSTPAALSKGLASALSSLAAVCPVNTTFAADGDLTADDPLTLALYLTTGDAIANAVKHAQASRLEVRLSVRTEALVTVRDNGVGGVDQPPPSLASRTAEWNGTVAVHSPPGGGTTVSIQVVRNPTAVGAR